MNLCILNFLNGRIFSDLLILCQFELFKSERNFGLRVNDNKDRESGNESIRRRRLRPFRWSGIVR